MGGKAKLNFWKSDGFVGLLVSVAVFAVGGTSLLQSLERKAYDLGMGLTSRAPSDRIAVIAIDKQSIDNIGSWPWARDVFAEMIEKLAAAQAKVIATTVLFAEPQHDPGLAYIDRLIGLNNARLEAERSAAAERWAAERAVAAPAAAQKGGAKVGAGRTAQPSVPAVPDSPAPEMPAAHDPLAKLLTEAEEKLNTDRRLAAAIAQAGNVVLPVLLHVGEPGGRPDRLLPQPLLASSPQLTQGSEHPLIPTSGLDAGVLDVLAARAAAIGHLNMLPDADGAIRSEALALGYFEHAVPALSLLVAAQSLNLAPADIKVRAGSAVRLGKLGITTDAATRMLPYYYGNDAAAAFPVDSFSDVKSGKISLAKYRDRIVLIGPTAAGVGSQFVTPVAANTPSVLMLAHTVSSILSGHFFVMPAWGSWAELGAFLLIALYLILVLPRLTAGVGAALTTLLLLLLLGSHFGLMATQLLWLQLMAPVTLLLVGHLSLTTKRLLVTERHKAAFAADPAESNRMLGLALQSQGQLDMAFDQLRKCPLDEPLMESLYSLGLDFERQQQFNKAEAVFRYMADYRIDFRDLAQRLTHARQLAETVILGGAGGHSGASTITLEGGTGEKSMLGRYQIEKELGKGAMGVVYQGRDPKINRVVAIKTMALSQEFAADELVEVKERFFREAETAGRLNHTNIVTMFDAGEEHDLAYIAMEFLKGRDLVPQTKPGALLPLPQVISIVARVAEALDYAHANQVVHRDIKPANIMYEPEADQVKVTDFGIARITDSSKTKTGMVLGTPTYMSPEQLAGKKIDGRSDLFSLGVTLFQLCSGRLPFIGESMAQLMFKIAGEAHPDLRTLVPGIPDCVAAVIDKALVKDPDRRYQKGGEMARDLRQCLQSMGKTN